ncbi:TetR/AcrR family transcriptional regulator [Atopomonas sediminilitoris]|uniref:TetR/AcrR family transcriptional regulator n=1 Tax=Atopomonas sediminilitoris TaxID=2919919 RepID=UPI001F4D6ADA|nr:TetR/AcrR family transcriptional regulator [Atopomonas sediminilitoris]MCJ8169033.1 TetR/AcrR family transcriptional regulator [Atopomonas sediminilitoris]
MDEQQAQRVMLSLVERGELTDPQSARGKLLQCAAHLFRHKGYERTTVRDLAGAVGIQSGSIFHHFKSKDEILRAVMEETILYNTALMRDALNHAQGARERVLALIRCELQSIMGGTGEAMGVLVYEWRSLSDEGRGYILKLRDVYEQMWLTELAAAKTEGLLQGDPFVLRRFLTGALSWTTTWFKQEGSMSLDELAQSALLLVIK